MRANVDRWIPNYASLGFTPEQAETIALRCEAEALPGEDWTETLARVAQDVQDDADEAANVAEDTDGPSA